MFYKITVQDESSGWLLSRFTCTCFNRFHDGNVLLKLQASKNWFDRKVILFILQSEKLSIYWVGSFDH